MNEKPTTVQPSVISTLQSADGIAKSVKSLATLYLLYRAATTISGFLRKRDEASDRAERNEDQARRDLIETKQLQDKKDTAAIHQQVREAFTNRERAKVRFRPKSVRGHWEGNVFIPAADKPKQQGK
jgi:hypothetical protein